MSSLAILGPGILGLSLARHAAEQGLSVSLVGRDFAHAQAGHAELARRWHREVTEGRMTASQTEACLVRVAPAQDLGAALASAEALLEALPEDLTLKRHFWEGLASEWPEGRLALTASSSLAATQICASPRLGLMNFHPFVPVRRHPLVELACPNHVAPNHLASARALASILGLRVIEVSPRHGLPAARMGLIQGLEAMRLLEEGIATAADLDALMVEGYGHPCGPLELSDRIGLDLRLAIAEALHRATGDARFEPPPILRQKVLKGDLGRKTGRGFHAWPQGGRVPCPPQS